jgi:hypothetical protein
MNAKSDHPRSTIDEMLLRKRYEQPTLPGSSTLRPAAIADFIRMESVLCRRPRKLAIQ